MTLSHHELCFGCGNANLFGLQMEIEPADGRPGAVVGRFFVKQDHQGADGQAHRGVIASALEEAMAMSLFSQGVRAEARRLEVELLAPAPVGVFLRVEARVERRSGGGLWATASVREVGEGGRPVAAASGLFEET